MKTGAIIAIIIIVIVAIVIVWWILAGSMALNGNYPSMTPTSTTGATPPPTTMTFDRSLSNGVWTISYPSTDFGLATNQQQLLVHSYITPCDQGFTYCLYYINTSTYAGTNFESAGIRIKSRTDLTTEHTCLTANPTGFTSATSTIATSTTYGVSVFQNVGTAGAGHYANGNLYRLFYPASSSCYEFETRIGQTQFANYPSGTIQQFTPADQTALQSEIQSIIDTIMLPGSTTVAFPQG